MRTMPKAARCCPKSLRADENNRKNAAKSCYKVASLTRIHLGTFGAAPLCTHQTVFQTSRGGAKDDQNKNLISLQRRQFRCDPCVFVTLPPPEGPSACLDGASISQTRQPRNTVTPAPRLPATAEQTASTETTPSALTMRHVVPTAIRKHPASVASLSLLGGGIDELSTG